MDPDEAETREAKAYPDPHPDLLRPGGHDVQDVAVSGMKLLSLNLLRD